jgi:hypothetical protein
MNEWIHLNWSTHTHCLRMSWETDWLSALPRQEAAGWVAEWGVTTTHGCGGGVGWGGEWMPPLSSSVGPDAPGCQILPVPEFIPPMSPLFNGWTIPLRKFGAGPLSRPQTSRPGRNFTGPFLGQAALNSAIWKHQLWKVILEVWGGGRGSGILWNQPLKITKGAISRILDFLAPKWPFKGPKKSYGPLKSLDFVHRDHFESLKWR